MIDNAEKNCRADCASPVSETEMARQLAALAHPARLHIVRHLSCCDHCTCKDVVATLPLAQSTVSQHLKVLGEAGLVRLEHKPPRSRYSLDRRALDRLGRALETFASLCCNSAATDASPEQRIWKETPRV